MEDPYIAVVRRTRRHMQQVRPRIPAHVYQRYVDAAKRHHVRPTSFIIDVLEGVRMPVIDIEKWL